MKRDLVRLLRTRAEEIAQAFSDPARQKTTGYPRLTYEVEEYKPLSEHTAAVFFRKSDGKRALAFFYWVQSRTNPRWEFFFPTDSHLLGMMRLSEMLAKVEQNNFPVNLGEP